MSTPIARKVGDVLEDGRTVVEIDGAGIPTVLTKRPKATTPAPVPPTPTTTPVAAPVKVSPGKPTPAPKVTPTPKQDAPVATPKETKAAPVLVTPLPKPSKSAKSSKPATVKPSTTSTKEEKPMTAKKTTKTAKAPKASKPAKVAKAKVARKSGKPVSNAPQGTRARYDLKDPKKDVPSGRIHGTGKRLTDDQKAEARQLRSKDKDVYTLRRLAAMFGVDPASMYYILKGGRAKAEAKAAKKASAKKSSK